VRTLAEHGWLLGPSRSRAAIGIYGVGLVLAATAPSMLVLVIARFVQGIGGGGLYVVSLATVAKTYPERIRPRVMALLASMWILPGLLGPPVGAVLAETVGWRYAFVVRCR
jgi:MFS family permease